MNTIKSSECRDPSELTLSEMLGCIKRLRKLTGFDELADYLEKYPEYFPRFVRDSRSAMLNIEHIFVEEPIHVSPVDVISVDMHPANDSHYRIAASFGTEEQSVQRPEWVGQSELGADIVKVLAAPADPMGRRVKLTIWIDDPKSMSAGQCLLVSFAETDDSQGPASVELRAIEARIQGAASIAMTWADFLIKAGKPLQITRQPPTN